MAALRKFTGYRKLDKAYTRKSKYKKRNYIRSMPNHNIIRFEMGDKTKQFSHRVCLVSKGSLQIRHNAIESTRQIVNRALQKNLGEDYYFQINLFPHHGIRENKLIGGSKAERMATGMQQPFGKVITVAAQVRRGKTILTTKVNKENVDKAKLAMRKCLPRLPGSYSFLIEENK